MNFWFSLHCQIAQSVKSNAVLQLRPLSLQQDAYQLEFFLIVNSILGESDHHRDPAWQWWDVRAGWSLGTRRRNIYYSTRSEQKNHVNNRGNWTWVCVIDMKPSLTRFSVCSFYHAAAMDHCYTAGIKDYRVICITVWRCWCRWISITSKGTHRFI